MAIKWISYIWERTDYREGDALVALALADFANDEGECHPYLHTLAKKSRLSVRQVQYILRKFEKDGFLKMVAKPGRGIAPQFQLKKMQSTSPFADRKKVQSATKKGAIHDIKKVQSATLPSYKEEPLNEPLNNRGERPARTFEDELLFKNTESVLKTTLDLDAKHTLCDSIPHDLHSTWLTYVKGRLLTVHKNNRTVNYLSRQVGFWLTDFARDYKNEYERLRKSVSNPLPTAQEKARIDAEQIARGPKLPPQFMQGMQKA